LRKCFDGARSLAVDTSPQMLQAGWELYEGEYFAARTKISAKELDYLEIVPPSESIDFRDELKAGKAKRPAKIVPPQHHPVVGLTPS
jgi:hypothetical protein